MPKLQKEMTDKIPMVNDYELIVPKYFAKQVIRNKNKRLKLLNPLSKERNIASRDKKLVIPIIQKNVKKPILVETQNQEVDKNELTPLDYKKLKQYNPVDNIKEAKTLNFKNETRGLPIILYKNLVKKKLNPAQLDNIVRRIFKNLGLDFDKLTNPQKTKARKKVKERVEFNKDIREFFGSAKGEPKVEEPKVEEPRKKSKKEKEEEELAKETLANEQAEKEEREKKIKERKIKEREEEVKETKERYAKEDKKKKEEKDKWNAEKKLNMVKYGAKYYFNIVRLNYNKPIEDFYKTIKKFRKKMDDVTPNNIFIRRVLNYHLLFLRSKLYEKMTGNDDLYNSVKRVERLHFKIIEAIKEEKDYDKYKKYADEVIELFKVIEFKYGIPISEMITKNLSQTIIGFVTWNKYHNRWDYDIDKFEWNRIIKDPPRGVVGKKDQKFGWTYILNYQNNERYDYNTLVEISPDSKDITIKNVPKKKVEGSGIVDSEFKNLIKSTYNPNEKVEGWEVDKDLSTNTSRVFKKKGENKVVVSHRGTKGFLDWANNGIFAIGGDTLYKLTPRYKEARRVQKLAEKKYSKKDYKISTIGHSQGARQAQMLGARSNEIITLNKSTRPLDLISASSQKKNQYDYSTTGDVVSAFRNPFEKYMKINVKGKFNPLHSHSIGAVKEKGEIYGDKSF